MGPGGLKEVAISLLFLDFDHGRRSIGQVERVVGRGT